MEFLGVWVQSGQSFWNYGGIIFLFYLLKWNLYIIMFWQLNTKEGITHMNWHAHTSIISYGIFGNFILTFLILLEIKYE